MSNLAQAVERLDHERKVLVTQTTVLESVARGAPLQNVLQQLCELIEDHSPDSLCSVLLIEESSGVLRTAAAPSLPAELAEVLDGIVPGEGAGSCGTAAARGESVIVPDVRCNSLWDAFRDVALRFNIQSCWSSPIFGPDQKVLGTFAISHCDPRQPTEDHLALLRTASHLAGIALERDRVQRRSEELHLELHTQQRLESLGVLAGGIAHDFNNLMTVIIGNISLAARDVTDPETRELLAAAEEACDQSRTLSARFLSFAKGGAPLREPVDLDDVVRAAASFGLAGSDLVLDWKGAGQLPAIEADRSQLLQLLSNLLINAEQSTPNGGSVTLAAKALDIERGDVIGLEPGKYILLTVSDRGTGIDPDHLHRVFDPYFTLRDGGSGLGLATVYSIARAHGGRVEVESQLGAGTTFSVYLPAASEPASHAVIQMEEPPTSEGRLLVMDDEPAVLRIAKRFLVQSGYDVETAEDGESAIQLFSEAIEKGDPFDAVVFDLTVRSGMGGHAAIQRIREIDPGVAAVVASGYSSDAILSSPDSHGFDSAVAKPFRQSDLVDGVQRAVEIRRR